MKNLVISSDSLLNALETIKKVQTKNPIVPILSETLLQVSKNGVFLTGSDLQTFMRFKVTSPVEVNEPFSAMLPPSFINYLKKLDLQSLTIEPLNELAFQCLGEDKCKFTGYNSEEFPKIPSEYETLFSYNNSLFSEFPNLLDYASTDELRPAMCGINFSYYAGKFNVTATDGSILKVVNIPSLDDSSKNTHLEEAVNIFTIPSKAAKILSSFAPKKKEFLKGLTVSTSGEHGENSVKYIHFRSENLEIITRDINEKYPNYMGVMPVGYKTIYHGQKTLFLSKLDKANLIATKAPGYPTVRMSLNGKNVISSEDIDFNNEYIGEIKGGYTGDPIEIGFNGEKLQTVLNGFSENFNMQLTAPNKCALIEEGNSKALIMPVMLNTTI